MKPCKSLQLLIVAMLLAAFTIAPAAAQGEPQVGEIDADGDLVMEALPPASIGSIMPESGNWEENLISPDSISPSDQVGVDAVPISPGSSIKIMDKTPTFTFSKDAGATMYQIEVWNAVLYNLVYSIKGAGKCNASQCTLTPTTKLKPMDMSGIGAYIWHVRSKTASGWGTYTATAQFLVISPGFNSTFDQHMKKWGIMAGNWFRTDSGYLKSNGLFNTYASVAQKEVFYDDYTYTTRMKVKSATDNFQGVIIGGVPTPLWSGNVWYDGVYFLYQGGKSSVWMIRDGTNYYFTGWSDTASIIPTGWNVLEVLVDSPNAYFMINGVTKWVFLNYPSEIEPGVVGFVHYKYIDKAPMVVDWAKLSYLPTGSAEGIDLDGAMVIDFNNLPPMVEGASPLEPPQ